MNKSLLTLLLALAFVPTVAFAADNKDDKDASCEAALTDGAPAEGKIISAEVTAKPEAALPPAKRSEFKIIPSPRVPQDAAQYEKYVVELMKPGGIIEKLGIKMTGQIVEFLTPRDLNALTSGSAGGYPISHYLDGAAVTKSYAPRGGGFALEVVYPGPNYQHGFYRDDNPVAEQLSIIDHVIGHNNFAFTSGLTGYRYGQGMEATRKLDNLLRNVYRSNDKDTIQRYYLWALTLSRMWDWYAPLLETSGEFSPELKYKQKHINSSRQEQLRHPGRVTENVLAAFASNLGPHEPTWKKAIIEHLFTSMSFRPPLVHTQIMNEGWASIMQEIIPKHTENNHNFQFWLGASRVMQTEKSPNLQDPYSLGVALWRRIRERLFETPEFRAMKTELERDRAFIAKAEEIIGTMTDEEFIRFGVDQTFANRHNLAVVKKLPREKWDPNMPPPKPGDTNNWQWKIVSKDAKRVAQMIIDRVLKPKYYFNPRVKLADFSRPGSGEVELILDDEVGVAFPLEQEELAPSLYAMANVLNKPVSLVCTIAQGEFVEGWAWNPIWGPRPPWWEEPQTPELVRVRVVVAPNGDLKVYRITDPRKNEEVAGLPASQRELTEKADEELTKHLLGFLNGYIEDLYLEDNEELQSVINGSSSLRSLKHELVSKVIDATPYDGMVSQSPNSAGALVEYQSMLERRIGAALEKAARQKGGLATGPNGVRLKALPSVVNLSFDHEYISKVRDQSTTSSRTLPMALNRTYDVLQDRAHPLNPDEGGRGSVGGIPGEEGDHMWGPGDNQGGKGNQPGEDPEDLSWIDLPEGLYEKFLGERVKLPILNKKPGESRTKSTKRGGSIRRKHGVLIPDDIMTNALKRGVGALAGDEDDPFEDLGGTLETGFGKLQPRDIVVKSRVPAKKPDVKAVVTFILDASGSTAQYYEAFKRFVFDVEALVKANYKGVAFRYIVFDTEAHVMKNKTEFFKAKLGGGTIYSKGIRKAKDDFEANFPRAQYDRYAFVLGDMEDFSAEQAMADIEELLENSEFFGAVAGLHNGGQFASLHQTLPAAAASREDLGYTVIDEDGGYTIRNIKEVLKNKEDE